ncbi:hypothetical protein [Patulibacter sp.]|uniref:hypothetical protein n=1 Tax=Patulibacter sp. TaxID=1912859 RepID=UPI0027161F25|nr:hypothetical protein [Patulibacter sp.]MDO9407426.1 hypothetical protein [Patulibacter sp.]
MSPRFTTNLLLAVLGGTLLTASLTFGFANAGWIALGVGAAAFTIAAVGFADLHRGAAQRWLDVLVALVGVWTVVESRVFDDGALRWISFGGGCALAVLAAAGLVLHERSRQAHLAALTAAADPRNAPARNGSGPRSSVPAPEVAA